MKTKYNLELIDKLHNLFNSFPPMNRLVFRDFDDEIRIFITDESGLDKTIICNLECLNILSDFNNDF
jgi:hypothetical protein